MRGLRATDAEAPLADLPRKVEGRVTIAITRHGNAVAHLIPAPVGQRARWAEAMDRFRRARAQWQPTGMSRAEILAARHAGHRL